MPRRNQTLLVIGGLGGVGSALTLRARLDHFEVSTADLSASHRDLHHIVDVANGAQVVRMFREHGPWDHVIVASGVNTETKIRGLNFRKDSEYMMLVNYLGPMVALQAWLKQRGEDKDANMGHFVVVSSNSAHIPRSQSAGYCASKAALSMAIQCAARAEAKGNVCIWGVEPGWINYTNMSRTVARRIGDGQRHRIPGGRTLNPDDVADFIVDGIVNDTTAFNGCMFRLDGGEL